jgi:hypothetical protein
MWAARIHKYDQIETSTLNWNLIEVGWLRTHIMVMPISALFLPIDFGPSFPQSWGYFFVRRCFSFSALLSAVRIELSSDVAGARH